ncbi:hypothetical protein A2U01_0032079, partial [Trifolium medium]|nr:hypothetical protein [Trifolium medium]
RDDGKGSHKMQGGRDSGAGTATRVMILTNLSVFMFQDQGRSFLFQLLGGPSPESKIHYFSTMPSSWEHVHFISMEFSLILLHQRLLDQ